MAKWIVPVCRRLTSRTSLAIKDEDDRRLRSRKGLSGFWKIYSALGASAPTTTSSSWADILCWARSSLRGCETHLEWNFPCGECSILRPPPNSPSRSRPCWPTRRAPAQTDGHAGSHISKYDAEVGRRGRSGLATRSYP